MKYLFISIVFISLLSGVLSDDLYYSTVQQCIGVGMGICKQWNTTVYIGYYQSVFNYMCFPSTTYVLSQSGPIAISDLKIGDSILGYDFQSSQNRYSTVSAWLHRDTQSTAEFTVIKTKQGEEYIASSEHNIAYSANGTISFKFADKFQDGDQLVSIDKNKVVQRSDGKIYKKGLYSPVNSINNFYIFPAGSNLENQNNNMILVHCFSQINRPHQNEHWVHSLLKISDFLGLNSHENVENQQYLHPITYILNIFSVEHRKIRVLLSEGDLGTIQLHHQRVRSSSSTSNNQQQKKNNIITVFSYLLMNNFLIIS